ncbi:MAG: UvrD-helicase domain-containing protein, partial [Spirochaetaceae bacterium]|nr:UvrD-helicase domain-containing protein [Spirochaetaceae bacterium]
MGCEAILAAILAELDDEQRTAATATINAVVTAGAGSGKTKVLAARYAWLVMEQGYRVDEILTLTFTNKAVSEMYSRIYSQLADHQDNKRARDAVRDFHKANICTIDSFCAGIARTASRRYGIAPDFTSDDEGVRDIAMEMALPFILEHRRNPALQILMADRKIGEVAEKLFARTVLNYSSITSPLDFGSFMRIQAAELLRRWRTVTEEAAELTGLMAAELPGIANTTTQTYAALKKALEAALPEGPDISVLLRAGGFPAESLPGMGTELRAATELSASAAEIRKDLAEYLRALRGIQSVVIRKPPKGMEGIKEYLKRLKDGMYGDILSIANFALQSGIITAVFPLLDDFQQRFNRKKREAGLLTFQDIARLAVDALARYPDIRQVYKESLKAIMIDEFQDNNALQRDLIFLLAEKSERREQGIPPASELSPGRMFFVGDEKQSIYRFRGADVSVFRILSRTLIEGSLTEGALTESSGASLGLIRNYRSKPALITAFNRIFGGLRQEEDGSAAGAGVFLSKEETEEIPDYEALYSRVYSPYPLLPENAESPPVHFCFLDRDELPEDDPDQLSSNDLEAAFIALKIRELVDSGYQVQERSRNGITS